MVFVEGSVVVDCFEQFGRILRRYASVGSCWQVLEVVGSCWQVLAGVGLHLVDMCHS